MLSHSCVTVTQGDIQQLLIVGDPRAAETYCQDYIPDCDAPLAYNNILTDTQEVGPNQSQKKSEGRGKATQAQNKPSHHTFKVFYIVNPD